MKKLVCSGLLLLLVACEERTTEEKPLSTADVKTDYLSLPIDLQTGERVYRQVCANCHAEGIVGAQKMGDKESWQPIIAKGMGELIYNAIDGYQGNRGVMPPKGGVKSLTDAEVASAVAYMVEQNR